MDLSDNKEAAERFWKLLGDIMDQLMPKLPVNDLQHIDQTVRNVSKIYTQCLGSTERTNWSVPANRCAYVFLYLVHHCYTVHCSLRHPELKAVWGGAGDGTLRVCSVGGGPGSDLLGLAHSLADRRLWPKEDLSISCLVLDMYAEWEDTWKVLQPHLPGGQVSVDYRQCDLVNGPGLADADRDFVRRADLVTLIKSFSVVSSFFQKKPQSGDLLRSILGDVKEGGFVLYVDNDCESNKNFHPHFAGPAHLELVSDFSDKVKVPKLDQTPPGLQRSIDNMKYRPVKSCELIIQLFRKLPSP